MHAKGEPTREDQLDPAKEAMRERMRLVRAARGDPQSRQRTRVTNGTALLPDVDGRNMWVRRCKDVIASHLSDLGGNDNTSAAERSLIRRASVLTVELERLESKFANAGEASDSDLDLYQRTAGNLRRLLEAVGIQRRPKEVESLTSYLQRAHQQPQQQDVIIDAEVVDDSKSDHEAA